jgi:hypothetical protein
LRHIQQKGRDHLVVLENAPADVPLPRYVSSAIDSVLFKKRGQQPLCRFELAEPDLELGVGLVVA